MKTNWFQMSIKYYFWGIKSLKNIACRCGKKNKMNLPEINFLECHAKSHVNNKAYAA